MSHADVRVFRRPAADADIDAAARWIPTETGREAAGRFLDDLRDTIHRLGRFPDAGSDQLGARLGVPGLRTVRLASHPYLMIYLRFDDRVDVVRVLHGHRDLDGVLLLGGFE